MKGKQYDVGKLINDQKLAESFKMTIKIKNKKFQEDKNRTKDPSNGTRFSQKQQLQPI